MTPIGFDHVNLTAETDEHLNRVDIEDILLWKISQSVVKVSWLVFLSNHSASIGLGTSIIDDVILTGKVKPSTLHLRLHEPAANIENQVVRPIVPDWSKDAPPTLKAFKNGSLFGYVATMLCVHT